MTDSGNDIRGLAVSGGDVVGPTGSRIGPIDQVYTDDQTGEPTWVTVQTGLGATSSFVPLRGASRSGNDVVVAYEPDVVSGAPQVADDGSITPEEESELLRYYERGPAEASPTQPSAGVAATDDGTMTRSEERLRVAVQRRVRERVRIRKVIVTEEVTQTFPVRREELIIERVPVASEDVAASDPDTDDEPYEVVLYAERPVVRTEVVPTERIRVTKERLTEQVTVTEDLRSEQIDTTIDKSRPDPGERR